LDPIEKPLIRIEGLHYTYQAGTREPVVALRGIDLTIAAGEYVAIVGANGSGKSTLLRHCNALLLPSAGTVWVNGKDTRDSQHLRDVRRTVGMVFQVPDNQIVATIVEEDVAFGPENLGVPEPELRRNVDRALATVGLSAQRYRASHMLSAGQKQRLAIASALAIQPRCLVLDEATAMLDPGGRTQVLQVMQELHRQGIAIVTATHNMAEAAIAEHVVVLSNGQIALQGDPRHVFSHVDALRALELDLPPATQIAHLVASQVPNFPRDLLDVNELVQAVMACAPATAGGIP
jgi:energy-coupling factor transport system ATP-binding protein